MCGGSETYVLYSATWCAGMSLSGPYLAVDVDHIPGVLELADVVVTEQSILLIGVEEREVLHDDGCKNTGQS